MATRRRLPGKILACSESWFQRRISATDTP
jgi:hypothetical protein